MYTEFFGLKEKPFNLTPSPRFLYLGESHKEALALLTYGVKERKGFILLTGEVGTGKTTMVQALLENLGEGVDYVYLSNPLLSPDDLMNYLASSALKKRTHFKSKSEFILEFEVFLKQCLQQQKNFVLVIDEAQKLSFELLEEIRLLSNMETADEKLINIFLVGQPELNEKLSEQRCRPLLQRISIRHHISPLNLEEIDAYVKTRLSVAGARNGRNIFPGSAIKALHEYSSGYPRMINILADNALLLGYARGKKKISPEMIRECYQDMKLEGSFLRSKQEAPEARANAGPDKARVVSPWIWVTGLIFILLVFGLGMS
ncbi:MAG: ExeA family protein, partial [Desulfatiglandales bacterium]